MEPDLALFNFASYTLHHAVPDLIFVLDWMERELAVVNYSSDTWTHAVRDLAFTAEAFGRITLVSSAAPASISSAPSSSSSLIEESIAECLLLIVDGRLFFSSFVFRTVLCSKTTDSSILKSAMFQSSS